MTAFLVQPCWRTMPDIRALNETTRFMKAQSLGPGFPPRPSLRFSAASRGSLRRVEAKLASRETAFFAQDAICAGVMLTEQAAAILLDLEVANASHDTRWPTAQRYLVCTRCLPARSLEWVHAPVQRNPLRGALRRQPDQQVDVAPR